ncbi:MAG TPA: DegT/DnrJ/EryC1/StrS aminotransferase family protein [bacterium]|nr:DegT/DnrJ/EryC1/StrS aminotransferase family protein [bacterium]
MDDKPAIEGGTPVRQEPLLFHRPVLGPEEERAVLEAMRSGWITTGRKCEELERRVAAMSGAAHGVAMTSGTAALHVALLCLDLRPGDEVITTPITFAATVNMIEAVGARPVFVDVRSSDLNIDPDLIAAAVTSQTRAVMPVHMTGIACDLDPITELAREHGLRVIEDAAHALGTFYKGRPVGSISELTCMSFYATKNVTTGEGGMLVTNDDAMAERARRLRWHGINKEAMGRYGPSGFRHTDVKEVGFKYNLSDVLAAIGLSQLDKFPAFQQRRREIAARYDEALGEDDALALLTVPDYCESAYHLYAVMVELGKLRVDRDHILNALQREGIGVGVHFLSVPEQSYYRDKYGYRPGSLPHAERASRSLISLPLNPWLGGSDVDDVIAAVKKVLGYYRK